jgi:hypothetical protein
VYLDKLLNMAGSLLVRGRTHASLPFSGPVIVAALLIVVAVVPAPPQRDACQASHKIVACGAYRAVRGYPRATRRNR